MPSVDEIGERIQTARRDAGFKNPESLAAALGVSPATVSRYEQGRTTPTITRLREIAALTGQTLRYFVDEA